MDTNVYSTDHIYVAAYLVCRGHEVVGTRGNGSRVSFIFNISAELSSDVASFLADGVIPARHFSFELLKLKRMLYGGKYGLTKSENNENYQGFNSGT
jgi:hypothetical protein